MTFVPVETPFVKVVRSGARDANGNLPAEVWREEQTAPTLNSMDNTGETRATVIFTQNQREEVRDLNDLAACLQAQPGIHLTNYVAQPVIAFTAQRVGEPPRIYEDSTPSLLSRMGTGGNNVPMIAQDRPPIGFNWANGGGYGNANPGLGITVDGVGPLSTSQVPAVAQTIPIQDGREIEKRQNGLGVGKEGDPAYTLDTTGAQAVAQNYAVRRLTPLECERLMGWPDDHTRHKADGSEQADSNRYKQCGNGVATPVARWVARQIMEVLRG